MIQMAPPEVQFMLMAGILGQVKMPGVITPEVDGRRDWDFADCAERQLAINEHCKKNRSERER